jgi:glycosyltransferase involved in cell wall biosynthesis
VIRVLHVIDSLGRGGAERQLVNLATTHDRAAVESQVVTLYDEHDLAGPLQASGISVESLHLRPPRQMALGVRRLRRILSATRPDVVHARLVTADFVARLAVTGTRIPLLSSLEAPTYAVEARRDYSRPARAKLQLVRLADMVTGRLVGTTYLACSTSVAQSTRRALRLPPDRIRVLPNSTVVPDEAAPIAVSLERDDEVRLLVIGRLSPQKGHVHLLRALPALASRYPGVGLHVVGDGPLRAELDDECVRLGIADRVHFHGVAADVSSFLRRAHILVLPSLWEGLSLVLLEAMAHAVPIVASDIASVRDVVRPGVDACLVPPGDPGSLAEAIMALLEDPSRRAGLAAAGRCHAEREFDVRRAASRLEALYRELADRAR